MGTGSPGHQGPPRPRPEFSTRSLVPTLSATCACAAPGSSCGRVAPPCPGLSSAPLSSHTLRGPSSPQTLQRGCHLGFSPGLSPACVRAALPAWLGSPALTVPGTLRSRPSHLACEAPRCRPPQPQPEPAEVLPPGDARSFPEPYPPRPSVLVTGHATHPRGGKSQVQLQNACAGLTL